MAKLFVDDAPFEIPWTKPSSRKPGVRSSRWSAKWSCRKPGRKIQTNSEAKNWVRNWTPHRSPEVLGEVSLMLQDGRCFGFYHVLSTLCTLYRWQNSCYSPVLDTIGILDPSLAQKYHGEFWWTCFFVFGFEGDLQHVRQLPPAYRGSVTPHVSPAHIPSGKLT